MDTRDSTTCDGFRRDLISRLESEWVPTGDCDPLSEELRAHARECPRCAQLLVAFDLLAGGGESITAPPGLANRIADSFPLSPPAEVRISRPGSVSGGSLARWGAGLAAAAILVVTSVLVTTFVLEREVPMASSGAVTVPSEVTAPPTSGTRASATVVVRLELLAPAAESVAVVGDWNGWDPQVHPLSERNGTGLWEIEIEVLSGEEYRYQFLVDGEQWIPDPEAPIAVGDGFGGTNSVLNI